MSTTTATTVNLATALAAMEVLKMDPRNIYADPSLNTRSKKLTEKEIKGLKEDIRENGVQSPVKLYISDGSEGLPEAGTPVLAFGFTRVGIATELINETGDEKYFVPYTVFDHVPSKLEAFEINLSENFQRNDLTTWDTVLAIKRFEEEFGVKAAAEIAKQFGKSPAWVTQHRKLYSDLHPEIQKRLAKHESEAGFVPGSVAMELVNIEDKEEQLKVLHDAELEGSGVATRDVTKKKVAEAAEQGKAPIKAKTSKQYQMFLESLAAPPTREEDEEDEAYDARVAEYKSDPLVPYAKLTLKFLAGKTKEKSYIKALREVVQNKEV